MAVLNQPNSVPPIRFLKERAHQLRRNMLRQARGKGQAYLGQGLDISDALAALYFYEMRYDPENLPGMGATGSSSRQVTIRSRFGQYSRNWGFSVEMTSHPMERMKACSK